MYLLMLLFLCVLTYGFVLYPYFNGDIFITLEINPTLINIPIMFPPYIVINSRRIRVAQGG